ncbi:hypothetical protein [Rhizobacter sp. LjRoot28]|uniref:hypothetical protein n=1 Tax=Rhizobacter sp. LjRoot28 TaxID=3342309 RepID=UPI003ECE5DE3
MPTAIHADATARQLPVSLRHLVLQDKPAPGLPGDAGRDRCFVSMLRAFRETGGLVRGDEVAELLAQRGAGDVSRLARWIVSREVIAFDWRGELWVPLFQFDLADMSLRAEVRQVARALESSLDGWGIAVWFSAANARLDERAPVEVVVDDPAALLASVDIALAN